MYRITMLLLLSASVASAQVRVSGPPALDTAGKATASAVKQAAKVDTNDVIRRAIADRRYPPIPIVKKEFTDVAPSRPGKTDSLVINVRSEPLMIDLTDSRSANRRSCGNIISCHKVISGVAAVIVGGALAAWANKQGWFTGASQTTKVDVSISRTMGAGVRIPIRF